MKMHVIVLILYSKMFDHFNSLPSLATSISKSHVHPAL